MTMRTIPTVEKTFPQSLLVLLSGAAVEVLMPAGSFQ